MSDDIFADAIAESIQPGKDPRPPKKPRSYAAQVRAWCILALALAALGVSLGLVAAALIH